jgi:Icc protein
MADLEFALTENDHQPVLLALHHPPIPTGSRWMDEISLINQTEFRHLLSKFSHVRAVIFGHAHQEMDETRDGIRWLCCPSTNVQFLPRTESAYSDTRLPGYRWLRLHHDGRMETGVERLAEWPECNGPDRRKWS